MNSGETWRQSTESNLYLAHSCAHFRDSELIHWHLRWATLWLVNKIFYTVLGQNPAAGKNVDTSRFWVIFENSQNCMQIIGMPRRSIFHAPKSSQMPYTAKIKKINNFTNKIKNPLERRLAISQHPGLATSLP